MARARAVADHQGARGCYALGNTFDPITGPFDPNGTAQGREPADPGVKELLPPSEAKPVVMFVEASKQVQQQRGARNRPARGDHEPPLPENIRRLRRMYVETLDDAEVRGTLRPPAATPHEFSPALNRTYSSQAPAHLSDRFAAGRYGLVNPSAEELSELERELEAARKSTGQ